MTPVTPGLLVRQEARASVAYGLETSMWGVWWTPAPTVRALRPRTIDQSTLTVRVVRQASGRHLVVSGGVDGASYEVVLGDGKAFKVLIATWAAGDLAREEKPNRTIGLPGTRRLRLSRDERTRKVGV